MQNFTYLRNLCQTLKVMPSSLTPSATSASSHAVTLLEAEALLSNLPSKTAITTQSSFSTILRPWDVMWGPAPHMWGCMWGKSPTCGVYVGEIPHIWVWLWGLAPHMHHPVPKCCKISGIWRSQKSPCPVIATEPRGKKCFLTNVSARHCARTHIVPGEQRGVGLK